eukprot:SAG22_NODE_182_length_16036_cov_13.692226_8_plen_211_part_00
MKGEDRPAALATDLRVVHRFRQDAETTLVIFNPAAAADETVLRPHAPAALVVARALEGARELRPRLDKLAHVHWGSAAGAAAVATVRRGRARRACTGRRRLRGSGRVRGRLARLATVQAAASLQVRGGVLCEIKHDALVDLDSLPQRLPRRLELGQRDHRLGWAVRRQPWAAGQGRAGQGRAGQKRASKRASAGERWETPRKGKENASVT